MAFALGFAVYCAAAWRASPVLPAGDAPHYLVITQSLLRDGDLRIENNHLAADYAAYFPGDLKPDYLRRGVDGQIYSIHAPGLSAIVAPAFALGRYPGVVVFLALLSALGASLAWRTSLLFTGSAGAAWFGWAAVSLSAPFLLHAFQVFPDALGAVLTMTGVAALVRLEAGTPPGRAWRGSVPWLLHGAAVACLPWLHTRFAVIALGLGACLAWRLVGARRYRQLVAFGLVPLVSAAAWFAFFKTIYGTFSPAAPYGPYTPSMGNIGPGLAALWLDQQFGVLPNAPVFAAALAGLVVMFHAHRRLATELTLIAIVYLAAVASYDMWWGGWSPPARFAVPVLLLLAVPAADFWSRVGPASRAWCGIALAASVACATVLVTVGRGQLMFNSRDGFARWLDWASPLADLPRALPSFLRAGGQASWPQSAIWLLSGILTWGMLGCVSRTTSHPGRRLAALATAAPLVAAVAAMLASTVCWRLIAAPALTPTTAQIRLLRGFDAPTFTSGLSYRPLRRMAATVILSRLRLRTSTRGAPPRSTPLFLGDVPAGTYRLEPTDASAAGFRVVEARIGRSIAPVERWAFDESEPGAGLLSLPTRVTAVTLSGTPTIPTSARSIALRSLGVRAEPPFPDEVPKYARRGASRAARYGRVVVLAFTAQVYLEEQGLWITGGQDDFVVVAPDEPSGRVVLLARNGAQPNIVTLRTRAWSSSLTLAGREQREVEVPLDRASGAVVLQVHTQSGFRPSEVDPGSRDDRYLGVWLEVAPTQ